MQSRLTKIFNKVRYEPDPELVSSIWSRIIKRDRNIVRVKLWVFGTMGVMSFAVLIPVFESLLNDFARSGFYEYFSLIFSDSGSIVSFWKEFTFSLLESLPMMSIIFTLSLIFVCFFSLRHLMRQIGKNELLSI